jgi:anthranilate phosphoribosyltransferase
MTWNPKECEEWVVKARFGACAVSGMLPALAQLRELREEIGVRTALSTVEKLLAPPGSSVVVGAHPGPVLGTAIEVVAGLEHPRALALQGPEGGLIPMVSKRTRGIELIEGDLVAMNVDPEDFGLASSGEPELPLFSLPAEGQGAGDTPGLVRAAGEVTQRVLNGEGGVARNAALLGAGLILKASGRCLTLADGVDEATRSLDAGAPMSVIEKLRDLVG